MTKGPPSIFLPLRIAWLFLVIRAPEMVAENQYHPDSPHAKWTHVKSHTPLNWQVHPKGILIAADFNSSHAPPPHRPDRKECIQNLNERRLLIDGYNQYFLTTALSTCRIVVDVISLRICRVSSRMAEV